MDDKTAIEAFRSALFEYRSASAGDYVLARLPLAALQHAIQAIEALAKLRAAADAVRLGEPGDSILLGAMYAVLDELDAADGTEATDDANLADMRREYNRKYGLGE